MINKSNTLVLLLFCLNEINAQQTTYAELSKKVNGY